MLLAIEELNGDYENERNVHTSVNCICRPMHVFHYKFFVISNTKWITLKKREAPINVDIS